MKKLYDEINEIKEVLETKTLPEEEYDILADHLEDLEMKKERMEGKKIPEKVILMDDVVRRKRKMDMKHKKKRFSRPKSESMTGVDNKRLANKVVRQHEDFPVNGSSYKKLYDEPDLA